MTFVTKLRLQSGDRAALDGLVADIQKISERKGAEVKGPHSSPPIDLQVPLSKRLSDGGDGFEPWKYTVYTRKLEIVGHNDAARQITQKTSFPDSIHVEATVEAVKPLGRS